LKSSRLIIFLLITCLKINAQFLDKSFYLVDSLEESKISNDDKKTLDTELNRYKKYASDTSRVQCLSRIIEAVQDEKIWIKYNRLMYFISCKNLKTANNKDSSVYKADKGLSLNNFGYYYYNFTGKYELALKYYQEGLELNEGVRNYGNIIVGYSNIAGVFQNKGDLVKALSYYQKALSFESKVENKTILLAPINNIAQIYLFLNDTLKAIKNLKKCFLISAKSNDKVMKATLLQNIGLLSYKTKDKSGLQSMKKALELRKQMGDYRGIVQSYASLGAIEMENGNLASAEFYLDEASKFIDKVENLNTQAVYLTQMSSLKELQGKNEEAILYAEKTVNTYEKFPHGIEFSGALSNLIGLYGNDPKYSSKKLHAYELYFPLYKNINKGNAQKVLMKQKFEEDLKLNEAKFKLEQQLKEEKSKAEKHKQQLLLIIVSIILLAVLIFSVFIYKALKVNKQKNKTISEQKIEVEKQKHLIEDKHKDITDSINYAQKIQSALIISEEKLNKNVNEAFVIFKPRDIVSGDFYWYSERNGTKIVALADCTGHGVPGAFMSMIGITLLNQIVNEKGITSPAMILDNLRKEVISALNTDASDKRDGMDMAIIAFNEKELLYAGANSQVLLISNGQLLELKPNKQPIGIYEKLDNFTEQRVEITQNLKVYLFSDGMVDQFGGTSGKKIKIKQFKAWLMAGASLPLSQQKETIESNLNNWKKGFDQTDDISMIGIKLA
jgi:serine phosphatase RsbU (regulator of sigma subunit)